MAGAIQSAIENGAAVNGVAHGDAVEHFDGFESSLSGLGTSTRDKTRAGVSFACEHLVPQQIEELWRGDALAARIIELIPDDMLREGWKVTTDAKPVDETIKGRIEELAVTAHLSQVLRYRRAYGGGVIFLDVDDGLDPMAPLRLDLAATRMANGGSGLRALRVYAAGYEALAYEWDREPTSRRCGEPIEYTLTGIDVGQIRAHHSRVLPFCGKVVSRAHRYLRQGFGDGVLPPVIAALREYGLSWSGAANALQQASLMFLKLEGMAAMVASREKGAVAKRLNALSQGFGVLGLYPLDAKDDFKRDTVTMTGTAEILRAQGEHLSALVDIPATRLLGISPGGLNATGKSDADKHEDRIKGEQVTVLQPQLERLVRILVALHAPGGAAGNWHIEFNPLRRPTAQESAEERNKQADTDVKYIAAKVLTADEVAVSRFGGEQYSTDTRLNDESRKVGAVQAAPAIGAVSPTPAAAPADLESTALNGAQVTAALQIVQAVGSGTLPRQSAVEMLVAFFQLPRNAAERILGEVGMGFQPASVVTARPVLAAPAPQAVPA